MSGLRLPLRSVLGLALGCACSVLGCAAAGAAAAAATPGATPFSAAPLRATAAVAHGDRPLLAVSCSSPRDCTAVGGLFAERWNGRRWRVEAVATPALSDTRFDYLAGVSCPARTVCMAVGSERPAPAENAGYAYSPLAELWSRSAWTEQSPPPSQTPDDYLLAVACPSTSDCVAVGQGVTGARAMGWNGRVWTAQLSPIAAAGMSVLNGVACTTPTRCMAVGYLQPNPASPFQPLAERWNGVAWSIVPTPGTPADQSAVLNAVSCTRRFCTAVGNVGYHQLVERWNGRRWSIQRTPNPAPYAELNAVSCVSRIDCVAVGALTNRSRHSIAERWNGRRWAIEPTPTPLGGSVLWGVACPSATQCVAVGQRGQSPLVERWHGSRWSIQSPS